MQPLTFISLFAGIGGLDLGLERAGMECVAQVENNEHANLVLARHWPATSRWDDVRTVGAHNLPQADLIAGGFPCQDISYAGLGAGLAGKRSGLWHEFARIVSELRPRYVLVENVAALLDRGMGDVLGTLASFGYDAEWEIISACAFGAPHTRERVFIVAYPASGNGAPRMGPLSYGAAAVLARSHSPSASVHSGAWLASTPDVRGMADGVSSDVERRERLGNAVVPQVAEFIGHAIMAHAKRSR